MFQSFIKAAIKHAVYEIFPEDGSVYCEIPECRGVYAKAKTFEDARNDLIETLEEWIFIRLRKNLDIPIIDSINLNATEIVDASY